MVHSRTVGKKDTNDTKDTTFVSDDFFHYLVVFQVLFNISFNIYKVSFNKNILKVTFFAVE